jgi:hypothetical protein
MNFAGVKIRHAYPRCRRNECQNSNSTASTKCKIPIPKASIRCIRR